MAKAQNDLPTITGPRNRRGFLGALLGLSAGAGAGVLLPLKGGVVAVSAEAAAAVPAEAVAMPFSSECLELRALRRGLREIHDRPHSAARGAQYYAASCDYQKRVIETMVGRQRRAWNDLVELAECAWHYLDKEEVRSEDGYFVGYTGRLARDAGVHGVGGFKRVPCAKTAVLAELVDAILDIGQGERMDPKMTEAHIVARKVSGF